MASKLTRDQVQKQLVKDKNGYLYIRVQLGGQFKPSLTKRYIYYCTFRLLSVCTLMISTAAIDHAVITGKVHKSGQKTICRKMECKDEMDDTDAQQSSLKSQNSASSLECDSTDI